MSKRKQSQVQSDGYVKEFHKIIEGFRYRRHIRELFVDWAWVSACALHQHPYHAFNLPHDAAFERAEAEYMEIVRKYKKEELEAFSQLLGIATLALHERKRDFLGEVYMGLDISQDRSGEFFTPFEVSLMMAQMIIGDPSPAIQEKGFITLAEPACGAGGMLIAAASAVDQTKFRACETLFFDATDVSKLCCHMTYIQTSLLSLAGIVRHGDTIRGEQWDMWFTPICRVFPGRTRKYLDTIYRADGATPAEAPPSLLWVSS